MNIVSPSTLEKLLPIVMKAGLTPMIHGSPAIGKSSIVKALADNLNAQLIDLRLSTVDPVDLNGFGVINKERNLAEYVPFDTFPIESTPLPKGKKGWILFLDEIVSAAPSVQTAAFKLILDRQVGKYNLHKNCSIVAAGNLITDRGVVNRMPTPLQSRMSHFNLEPNLRDWVTWAVKNKLDHRIVSYVEYSKNLFTFDPNHNDNTFAAPRTWEFANRLVNGKTFDSDTLCLLKSVLGKGIAIEFDAYTKVYLKLPKYSEIKLDPENAKLPNELSEQFAVTGLISNHLEKDDLPQVIKYIKRLELEFQAMLIKKLIAKDSSIYATPEITAWVDINAAELV